MACPFWKLSSLLQISVVTPNAITLASTLSLVPVLVLCVWQWFWLAAFLVFVHDMLDRLDGVVSRYVGRLCVCLR
jgi:phosphatidylglycerophosphate synthase